MNRPNLYQVPINRNSVEETQFISLISFLQDHPDRIVDPDQTRQIFTARALVNTAIGKIFSQAASTGALDCVRLFVNPSVRESGGRDAVPTCLSYRHLCLDMHQIGEAFPKLAVPIAHVRGLRNTLVLNATPYLSKGLDGYIQRDTDSLHSFIVRDLLCKSYDLSRTSPSWLEGDILLIAAHVYGSLISSSLARGFDTGREVQQYLQTCATLYFLNMVQTTNIALSTIQGKARKFYLPGGAEMTALLEKIEEVLGKPAPETLDDFITAVNGLGIPRLVINRRVFMETLRSIAPDPIASTIAIEYPPYFIWALLLTLIGRPSYLSIYIKKQNLNRDVAHMADLLTRSHLFLPELGTN